MTGRQVPEGALYYATSRRRRVVTIDTALLKRVEEAAVEVRAMLSAGRLPPPTPDPRRCRGCSLHDRCQPEAQAQLAANVQADALALFDPDNACICSTPCT